jgi:hypothetical protein
MVDDYSLLIDKVGLNENRQAVADGQEAKSLLVLIGQLFLFSVL